MNVMLEAVSTLIRNRRSVKPVDLDLGRPVPEELVWRLLENGTWAPTHGLTEPWKFHVFAGGARVRLAVLYCSWLQYKLSTCHRCSSWTGILRGCPSIRECTHPQVT